MIIVCNYCGCWCRYCTGDLSPGHLCFESSPNGKPWLVSEEACMSGEQPLHFNLTHTNELLGVSLTH